MQPAVQQSSWPAVHRWRRSKACRSCQSNSLYSGILHRIALSRSGVWPACSSGRTPGGCSCKRGVLESPGLPVLVKLRRSKWSRRPFLQLVQTTHTQKTTRQVNRSTQSNDWLMLRFGMLFIPPPPKAKQEGCHGSYEECCSKGICVNNKYPLGTTKG